MFFLLLTLLLPLFSTSTNDGRSIFIALGPLGISTISLNGSVYSEDSNITRKYDGLVYTRILAYNNHENILYFGNSKGSWSIGDLGVRIKSIEWLVRRNLTGLDVLAVDYVGRNIYYTRGPTASTKNQGIYVCSLDFLFCKKIVDITSGYCGLTLNPLAGKMVWINCDGKYNINRIMVANMDGSNVTLLLDGIHEGSDYQGIAFDTAKNDVYFADFSADKEIIEKINVDTKKRQIVAGEGAEKPYGLHYFNGYLYWSDWKHNVLRSIQVNNPKATYKDLHKFERSPLDIAIKHPEYQVMPPINHCTSMRKSCPWMCVPVPGSKPGTIIGKCICPENYKEVNSTCIPQVVAPGHLNKAGDLRVATLDDEENSYFDVVYLKELCAEGTACLNFGKCPKMAENEKIRQFYCICPFPFIGERCEIEDKLSREKVKQIGSSDCDDADCSCTTSWVLFSSLLFLVVAVCLAIFSQKNRRANKLITRILDQLQGRNRNEELFILDNVNTDIPIILDD